jgi:hypothetical protein
MAILPDALSDQSVARPGAGGQSRWKRPTWADRPKAGDGGLIRMTREGGGRYWIRTSDPADVNRVL